MNASKKDKKIDKNVEQWDAAIREAERLVLADRQHIRQLQKSIEIFRCKKEAGEPWPGENGYTVTDKAGTESVPA